MTAPLRIGILGAAKIAPSALLTPARERADIAVTHVAARDARREAEFAAEHGLSPAGGYQALVERSDLDLIYVALPPSAHCEWTVCALQAGKAVLCEKPFAMTAEEAATMVAAADRTELPLIEAFHYRFHSMVRRAETLIRDGALGAVDSARANFCTTIPYSEREFRWHPALGGGAVMDLGCYPIHALRTLIGSEPEVVAVSAAFERDVEAQVNATLRFAGEFEATIQCALGGRERALDLEIVGERGRLAISNYIAPHLGSTLRVETDALTLTEEAEGPSTYAAQLAHVVDVVLHGARPMTGGQDAIANMKVIDAIRAMAIAPDLSLSVEL